jgi:ATP adenylyltransferase/5',5'''-P-1,P-4-tetraphosphate phosphorylase II
MYSDKIDSLFTSQLQEWELARLNYSLLENVRTRKLDFGTFEVSVQFNPERMRSSAAKVDARSIGERPCFLCRNNRPPEQRGLSFKNGLTFLVNPFPIFNRHLTIPSDSHTDQRIGNNFGAMLSLAQAIPSFTVFYNGPRCGASAPDHFHFQAGNKGFMPLENDFLNGKHSKMLFYEQGLAILKWENYLRGIITLKGSDREKLIRIFDRIFERLSEAQDDGPEPMLNILTGFESGEWLVHIIPRKLHRPAQFFMHGSDKLLISPAAVDLGGVIITPREEDFNRITRNDIEDIFRQVCFEESDLDRLLNGIL